MSSITGVTRLLPVGIGEVSLLGPRGSSTGRARATLTVPCGGGPAITVDGKDLPTALTASRSAALGGQPVSLQVCGSAAVRIAAGQHRVVLQPNALTTPVSLSLTAKSLPTAPPAGRLSVASWGSTNRSVRVATTAPSLLVVPENSNAGWQATLHGERLPSVMVDGWEQAWILPAGATGTVSLRFAPQTTVAGGLIAGGVAAVVLVVFAIRPPRRRPLLAPAEPGRIGERATAVVALAAGVLLGSLPGLAVAAAVVGLEWLVRRHDRRLLIGPTWLPGGWRSLAAAAGLSGVAVAIALRPFSDVGSHAPLAGSGVIQLVCIAVVALTLLSSSADSGLGRGTAAPQAGQRETTRRRGRGRRGAGPPRV
jgi:arabinofuranan 3-O-arabinosyltransferase